MSDPDIHRPTSAPGTAILGGRRAPTAATDALLARWESARRWLVEQVRIEADAARLAPWLPVFFGIGILGYFAAPAEPVLAAPVILLALLVALAWHLRDRPLAFVLAIALAATAAGFAASCVRAALVAHPVLTAPTPTVSLTGFVESRDATERSDRVVLVLTGSRGRTAEPLPDRVRIAFRRGQAPAVGAHVEVRTRLMPLLGPTRPGGYDYALGAYFAGIGATGFALGRAQALEARSDVPLVIRWRSTVEQARRDLAGRIRTVLPGQEGAIAVALVTGIREGISPDVNEAMRISGLAHVLSISGLHMVLVAGTLFFATRALLALVPGFALRRPIKKWAAFVALAGAAGYLVISGAAVPTQRAFLMSGLVLAAVVFDRTALTLRTLAFAALLTLALGPESLLHPSFQMSFAATLALVSLATLLMPRLATPPAGGGLVERIVLGGGRWFVAGAATSLVAGLATTPYAAYHFHRLAPYGLLANVLAMPIVSFIIMPAAVLAVALMPFGYDVFAWQLMGWGIELMLGVARWVESLPAAEGRIAAFGPGVLLLATGGLLLLAIPASRLRLLGVPVLLLALALAGTAPRPDVRVDEQGEVVAVRGQNAQLSVLDARRNRIAAESWLAANGEEPELRPDLAAAFRCDRRGCAARLPDGAYVAVTRTAEAFLEDCRQAALIVTRLPPPPDCAAFVLDSKKLTAAGGVALRRVNAEWIVTPVRSPVATRPWYGRARPVLASPPDRAPPSGKGRERSSARPGGVPTPVPDDVGESEIDGRSDAQ